MKERLEFGSHPNHPKLHHFQELMVRLLALSETFQLFEVSEVSLDSEGKMLAHIEILPFRCGAGRQKTRIRFKSVNEEYDFQLVGIGVMKTDEAGNHDVNGNFHTYGSVEISRVVFHKKYDGPREPRQAQIKLKITLGDAANSATVRQILSVVSNGSDVYALIPGDSAKRSYHFSGIVQSRFKDGEEVTNRTRQAPLREFSGALELYRVMLHNDHGWVATDRFKKLKDNPTTVAHVEVSEFEVGRKLVLAVGIVTEGFEGKLLTAEYAKYELHKLELDRTRSPWLYGLVLRERVLGSADQGGARVAVCCDQLVDGGMFCLKFLDSVNEHRGEVGIPMFP
jgi:hypothetical protein